MCGIAGVFDPRATIGHADDVVRVVRAMIADLAHRGPDDDGIWVDPTMSCALGHRRLKVIDLSDAGHQPMVSSDGRYVVVSNGEIYNYRELAPRLARDGFAVRGRTDTEVLLNAISAWGERALHAFDGMFAFAVFDTLTKELFLARDPFGEKPLYYLELPGGGLAFASELAALARLPTFDCEISIDAMAELLMFQYVGAPRTIYTTVRKLPPGHWLRAAKDRPLRVERYFTFEPDERDFAKRTMPDVADELEELLVRAIERRFAADVPVGAFLSGGVDSSTVCALATKKLGRRVTTFSMGFVHSPESEHDAARAYADHLGLAHVQRTLGPDATEILPRFGALLDEPNVDWSCLPVYLLSALARERVTVALSGDGGDEMFAGYAWYFRPLEHAARHGDWRADDAYSACLLMTGEDAIARLFGEVPHEVRARIARLRDEINQPSHSLVFRLRRNEAENYLPGAVLAKVDRMSMRHALEVRTPFLNVDLARFAASLPTRFLYASGRGKLVLREVASRYLPRELIDRPKMGFGLPGADWAGKEIRGIAKTLLADENSRLRSALGAETIDDFLERDPDTHRQWALATLESWLRHHPATLPERSRSKR
jgi:asparagine synthase (glutamine-hydrolysing)